MAIIKSSTDGTTWTTATVTGTGSTTWATSTVHSLAYANGIWVAGNNADQVALSTSINIFNIAQIFDNINTGTTWTTRTSNYNAGFIYSVAYGNGVWAIGFRQGQIRRSTDAITWTTSTTNMPNDWYALGFISYGNGTWVAAGYYGLLHTSTDAIVWTSRTSNFPTSFEPGHFIQSTAYGNGTWVAVARDGQLRTSTNAITWVTRTSNFGTTNIFSIAYGNGLWVAGGGYGELRTSTNAITWVTRTSNFGNTTIAAIAYGNGLWMASGNYGQLRTSTDAIAWTTRNPEITQTIRGLGYGNGRWTIGTMGFGIVKTSDPSVSLPNTQISSFNTSFMAVSNNRPKSSTDGTTWTNLTGFEGVHVNRFIESQGSHVLLGNSGVLYQKNTTLTTWTTYSTGINDNFINGSVNSSGVYNIVGQNAIYNSTNLTTWTTITTPAASTVNDIISKS